MFYIYKPWDFRLQPWPPIFDTYVTTYRQTFYRQDVAGLCEYVIKRLHAQPIYYPRTTFTLINMYNAFTKCSVGKCMSPVDFLVHGPLTLTFSTNMSDYGDDYPQNYSRTSIYDTLWGPSREFITISIPQAEASRFSLLTMMPRYQERIYDIVGGMTYCEMHKHGEQSHEPNVIQGIKNWSIPKALKTLPPTELPYVRDFWHRFPSLLNPNFSDTDYLIYWTVFIAPKLDSYNKFDFVLQKEEARKNLHNVAVSMIFGKGGPNAEQYLSMLRPPPGAASTYLDETIDALVEGRYASFRR